MISINLIKIDNESFLGISLPKNQVLVEKIKKIPGRRWSNSRSKWLIPYKKEVWQLFKSSFKNDKINLLHNHQNAPVLTQKSVSKNKNNASNLIRITPLYSQNRKLGIWIKWDDQNARHLVKKIPDCRWLPQLACWTIPYTSKAIQQLQYLFGNRCWLDFDPEKVKAVQPKSTKIQENTTQVIAQGKQAC